MTLHTQSRALAMPACARAQGRGIGFRHMSEDDLPFMAVLYRSTRESELDRIAWSEAEKKAFIDMQFNAQHQHYRAHYPNALWLVVEQAGTAVGRLYLERWSEEHRIIDIALMPEARGQGIGEAILRDLIDEAGAAGKALSIHVEKENPAMRLYARLGFEKRQDKGVYDLLAHPCTSPVQTVR